MGLALSFLAKRMMISLAILTFCPPNSASIKLPENFPSFDMAEYEQVDGSYRFCFQGGAFSAARYEIKQGEAVTREEIIERIEEALAKDKQPAIDKDTGKAHLVPANWKILKPKPKYKPYNIWELSEEDLSYSRKANYSKTRARSYDFRIYISEDASVICIYWNQVR